MYNRRHELTFQIRRALNRDRLRYGVCVLALGGTLGFAASVSAQDNPIVDITDPNVSIDLSVLNDGGLSPQMGAPLSSTGATTLSGGAAFQAPGKDMPVSTLYVKPASGFKLPPQTKSIETKIVKVQAPEPVVAPEPVEAAAAEPATIKPVEVATAPPPPAVVAPPAPASAAPEPPTPETATPESMAQHEPAEPVAEPNPVVEAAPEPAAPSSPEAATAVAALTPPPPPMSAPEPTPQSQPMALKAEPEPASQPQQAVVPTPPPAPTLAAEATVVAEHDETQTTPMSSGGNGVVIALPPKPDTPAQVASLPPATGPLSDGDSLRIVFDAETSKLAQTARDALLNIATKMQSQDNLRLQLLAYAGDADTSASAARRLSLSRALAVRSFLIENGVRSTRIDVRALGNKSTEKETERVDITVVER